MKPFFLAIFLLLGLFSFAQQITYSDPVKDDVKDMDFEIIGKMNGNILVFKNTRQKYAVTIYDNDMKLKENVILDFLPDRTYNVDFVAYPDYFYLVYQYQRKSVVHCMYVKLDALSKKLMDPVELDTTQVGLLADNKIYNVASSDDKQKIMVFKIQKKNERFNFVTLLYDANMQFINKARMALPYNDRKDGFSDFLVDNDGDFVFTRSIQSGYNDYVSDLDVVTKKATSDSFRIKNIRLEGLFVDEVKLKVDNINKRYIMNSFYYPKKRGNIEGVYYNIWDKQGDSSLRSGSIALDDTIRSAVRTDGALKYAFNNLFLRNVVVKKDGGYWLVAEDYSTQTSGNTNSWNRWNYLYGSPYISPYNYYLYRPSYYGYYRPYYNNYGNSNTRYYYNNVMVLSIDKDGKAEWSNTIHKEQYDDNNDNYLSFLSFVTGGELHFLFNVLEKRNQLLFENTINPEGRVDRKPPLKSLDKGFEFMPKYGKQVGIRQVIVPCTYRNGISFAKIEY